MNSSSEINSAIESTPEAPNESGPLSAAAATMALQQLEDSARESISIDSGSEGDSNADSSDQSSAVTATVSDHASEDLGLDGTTEGESDAGGQDGDEGEVGGRGNWGHGKAAPWTTEQDLEVLRIWRDYPDRTNEQKAVEFNNRFLNERARTLHSVRQRLKTLTNRRDTIDSILKKMQGGGKGGDDGSGGAA